MTITERLDDMTAKCPEADGCPVLVEVREKYMAGEWGNALRYLKMGVGTCGKAGTDCFLGGDLLFQAIYDEERGRLQLLWAEAFGAKPLEIDFICANRAKLEAIKEAMELVDVIPLTFSLQEHPSGRHDVVRFTVEL